MSFVYLPVPAVDCLPRSTYSDGGRSVTSNSTPTAKRSSRLASATACSTTRRSGTMSETSTADPGVDAWISSLRASRVSRSRAPENGEAKSTSETSGLIPFASLTRCGPNGVFWRTHPTYDALDGRKISPRRRKPVISGKFYATWPAAGLMLDGRCYPQETLGPTTDVAGSGLLPTPVASDATRGGNTRFSRGNPSLTLALRQLPTPTVKGNYNRASYSGKSGDGLVTALKMLPTPLARDYRSGKGKSSRQRKSPDLPTVLMDETGGNDGLLNPPFVEWMMGWPIGWTASESLEKVKFQSWLQQFGRD